MNGLCSLTWIFFKTLLYGACISGKFDQHYTLALLYWIVELLKLLPSYIHKHLKEFDFTYQESQLIGCSSRTHLNS